MVFFFLIINFILFPQIAEAGRPVSAWRTRNTHLYLYSIDYCVDASLSAMEYADLNGRRSDTFAVYGTSSQLAANIICLNNGSDVTIFCSGDSGT